MKNLTGTQRMLLLWSIIFLIAAEAVKFMPLGGRTTKMVGLLELLLAMATGVGIGIAASFRKV
jgi:hypothetical protein